LIYLKKIRSQLHIHNRKTGSKNIDQSKTYKGQASAIDFDGNKKLMLGME
jgi:hypothetical protein